MHIPARRPGNLSAIAAWPAVFCSLTVTLQIFRICGTEKSGSRQGFLELTQKTVFLTSKSPMERPLGSALPSLAKRKQRKWEM